MKDVNCRPMLFFLFMLAAAIAASSCSLLPDGTGSNGGTPTPNPEDMLSLQVPLYTITLAPGESVPRTQMVFEGRNDSTYAVTLDGLAATKRIGDSFSWRGVIAPGVAARYNLRISPTLSGDDMAAAGPVELNVLNPVPVELVSLPPELDGTLSFGSIFSDLTVAVGETVPGTTLVFEGQSDLGAQLSGTSGYPYRATGDSLIWTGRLRGNVTVRYSWRVASVSAEQMRLLGTAEVRIDPA